MGYAECNITMESRIGSVSSGGGCSVRGRTSKSSPFCPRSSSMLTQSIVKDHMVSHYKKVYSAKAAIDASVPKSLIHSVKYNDQITQERLRRGGRPQSASSLSQRNSRASCSPAQSRLSVQYDDSRYLYSRSSSVSSPGFSSSFHAKEIVYPSYTVDSDKFSHHIRPASEIKYRSPPEATSHRRQSAYSMGASGDHSHYTSFQDPVQKTYSGDLLQKHSQHFTQDKPFTPKTLKSEKSSYLSQYRYYRAPRRKPTQDSTSSKCMRQETYHGSTKPKEYTQELYEPSQGFHTEHEWSEEEFNGTYFSASRQQSRAHKSRDRDLFDSSSRGSLDGDKSSINKSLSAEEEELMYLEFISAVTEDILSKGHISDRFLDRVMNRHIDMNRHQLDVGKMRHLLEVLRKEFEEPANSFTPSTEIEKKKNDRGDSSLPYVESGGKQEKTKKDDDLLSYASLIKSCVLQDYADPLLVSTPLYSPGTTAASPTETNEKDEAVDNQEEGNSSPCLSDHVSNNTEISEEVHQNQTGTTESNKEVTSENHEVTPITSDRDQEEVSYDGQSKELEDLGRSLSESLHVSSNKNHGNEDTVAEQPAHSVASVSDDEF
ncbi:spermatogenesis-associated protein 7 homolog isoform X2 [Pseudochaenichthys georgianus]|uniref:spermatogenesis-associated protein 7 homolog isoform X2 n=1 Tax=Pseudochaenichthys georgianus TaxID=52239 RepID=UPI00146A4D46|nr:spermatogenesis-associated protein 7 homolog isoform X2 [Pseudochaenichthys georgianus]